MGLCIILFYNVFAFMCFYVFILLISMQILNEVIIFRIRNSQTGKTELHGKALECIMTWVVYKK